VKKQPEAANRRDVRTVEPDTRENHSEMTIFLKEPLLKEVAGIKIERIFFL